MQRIVVMKGLPASGKTTRAMQLVSEGFKRVNKDDIRAMLDNGKHSRENEKLVRKVEEQLVSDMVSAGKNVVIDSTNFAYDEFWKSWAEARGVRCEVEFVDTPITECIQRDAARGDRSVGAKVIQGMYDRYLRVVNRPLDYDLPTAYIFDIDGTLALMDGRSPYDYTKVGTDIVNRDVACVMREMQVAGNLAIVMSGRDGSCLADTVNWLNQNNLTPDMLLMRPDGDTRNDAVVKKELYRKEVAGKFEVLGVFDDRNRVVDMWRSLGLTCFQVHYGNF